MSAESLGAQSEFITTSPDGKSMLIDPSGFGVDDIKRQLAETIFLSSGRFRIVFQGADFIDEITPKQIVDARMHWTAEDVAYFIDTKAEELSYADRITIEHLDDPK